MHIKNENTYIFKKILVIGYSIFCLTLFSSEPPWFKPKQAVSWLESIAVCKHFCLTCVGLGTCDFFFISIVI